MLNTRIIPFSGQGRDAGELIGLHLNLSSYLRAAVALLRGTLNFINDEDHIIIIMRPSHRIATKICVEYETC